MDGEAVVGASMLFACLTFYLAVEEMEMLLMYDASSGDSTKPSSPISHFCSLSPCRRLATKQLVTLVIMVLLNLRLLIDVVTDTGPAYSILKSDFLIDLTHPLGIGRCDTN